MEKLSTCTVCAESIHLANTSAGTRWRHCWRDDEDHEAEAPSPLET